MSDALTIVSSNKCHGGWYKRYSHVSGVLGCEMTFGIFLPPGASADDPVPVAYWLSGLTCNDENFMQKAGAQRVAAELGIALVAPRHQPARGGGPRRPDGAYDFGKGAGFYVNATQEPWARHYRMYDYVVEELPALVEASFPVTDRRSIFGHSMGGHGALICALRNPGRYAAVSAFAPIANPMNCPWGEKAFGNYLGGDRSTWRKWDATCLVEEAEERLPLLIDQGTDDQFLGRELKPEALERAARKVDHPITLRMHDGYDHSYFFIATFIDDHLRHHARALGR